MKRLCWVLLCALLCQSSCAAADHAFAYEQIEGGIRITGCAVDAGMATLAVPETIDGMPVVEIGSFVLDACSVGEAGQGWHAQIILPSSLRHMHDDAFVHYSGAIEVSPENEHYATIDGFLIETATGRAIHCAPTGGYIDTLIVPDAVKELGGGLFGGAQSFRTISLPDGLRRIGPGAFAECFALEEIVIPDTVQVIDDYAFLGCAYLEAVVFPDQLVCIGKDAFVHCERLTRIDLPDGLRVIEDGAFDLGGGALPTEVTTPSRLVHVGENAFRGREVTGGLK